MNILVTLCARGGSKGVPKKNIKKINGIPLIGYSINTAKKFRDSVKDEVDIALSTDSVEIKKVAEEFGIHSDYTRPSELATDTAGKIPVITDLKNYQEKLRGKIYDLVIDLDVTSPLRTINDLLSAFSDIKSNIHALNLFSVSLAHKNPYFNMVEETKDGFFELSKTNSGAVLSRQQAPIVFELNASFYMFKKEYFDAGFKTVYSGKSLIYQVNHICFDIDTETDFDFLNYLICNNKLNFEL